MKLCSFTVKNSYPIVDRLGAVENGGIIDLAACHRALLRSQGEVDANRIPIVTNVFIPNDMTLFLEGGSLSLDAAKAAVTYAQTNSNDNIEKFNYSFEEIEIQAPIKNPPTIRDFLSFEEHYRNSLGGNIPEVWYERPIYYKSVASTIIGTNQTCEWPAYSKVMDYELEFACVIGKRGENISIEEASNYIAGYLIYNDFSARDTQLREMEGRLGPAKGKDFCTSMGPYIVTPDEIEDVYNMRMTAKVNGEIWSDGHTSTMYRTFEEIISYVSQSELLVPGDILGSGTVGYGCGLELGKFLNDGDEIELEVGNLGVLKNKIVVKSKGEVV